MLYAFGFERVGLFVGDLYFVDPRPAKGQEGAERGVRLELRILDRGALKGSIYSAQPIEVGQPVWRADQLADLDGLLASAGFPADAVGPDDAESLLGVVPEIVDVTRRLLEKVHRGELGRPPRDEALASPTPVAPVAAGPAGASVGAPGASVGYPGASVGYPGASAAAPGASEVSIRAGWL
jgi:hypothetical protein